MKHPLPVSFLKKAQTLLGSEYSNFINSYEHPASRGLRINTLKVDTEQFIHIAPFALRAIPWNKEGYYYDHEERPGKHPYHAAGLYYIQEPSAKAVVGILDPQADEKILDLAAAPGGKATQIAIKMKNRGLLIANEIHPTRAKALSENVERLGLANTIVTNEEAARLAERFPNFFDRILLDAPCSGEGMFRKDEDARMEWSLNSVQQCSVRQTDLLEQAALLLKPGGRLVYSTCTFSPEENEHVIEKFLLKHHDWRLLPIPLEFGFRAGQPDWSSTKNPELTKTVRLWPHHVEGEGHFIALLEKGTPEAKAEIIISATPHSDRRPFPKTKANKNDALLSEAIAYWKQFVSDYLNCTWEVAHERYTLFGSQLYQLPVGAPSLDQLKVLRVGLHLGELKKKRFEPSHALALALKQNDFSNTRSLSPEQAELVSFLRGESIAVNDKLSGWVAVLVDGFPIGWGKATQGILKNHYPKGLRLKT